MDSTTCVIEAQPDWLTVTTANKHDPKELIAAAKELAKAERLLGNFPKPFAWRGYVGEHTRYVTWGEGPQGALVQLSSYAAALWFDNVAKAADHATRFDLQVTVKFTPPQKGLVKRGYGKLTHNASVGGFRPCINWRQSNDGGSTLYYGSPSSDSLGRVYDKWAESTADKTLDRGGSDYVGCWRYEIQYRSDLANAAFRSYAGADDRQRYCKSVVYNYWTKRGLNCPWTADGPKLQVCSHHTSTDSDRQLRWLAATVTPVVARFLDRGMAGRCLAALGLDERVCRVADGIYDRGLDHHHDDFDDGDTP